ncbi:MAG: hypothetical protein K8R48_05760 [Alphaproteobacteria bacterium]|nr:hypothetical protein [Alphaproteobacteria bacterium]
MFESILFRPVDSLSRAADVGLLAETLLFYQQVIIAADRGQLVSLLKGIGPDDFIGLMDDGHISVSVLEDSLGVSTNTGRSGIETHNFIAFEVSGHISKGNMSREEILQELIEKAVPDKVQAKRVLKKIVEKAPVLKINQMCRHKKGVTGVAYDDLDNERYAKSAAKALLDLYVPNYSQSIDLQFRVVKTDNGIVAMHNIDYALANKEFHRSIPPSVASINNAFILSRLLSARGEMFLSAHYLSELVTSPEVDSLLESQFDYLLIKRDRNANEIKSFQDLILKGNSIRNTLNKGEKTFSDFRQLLDQAKKFKGHLEKIGPDEKLVTEYYKAATAETWVDRLPEKIIRFSIFSLIGSLAHPLIGFTAGAADALLLDKVLKGWKPNHFVEGPLKKFMDGD